MTNHAKKSDRPVIGPRDKSWRLIGAQAEHYLVHGFEEAELQELLQSVFEEADTDDSTHPS